MIKLMIVGRRRAGATRAQALHHLKTVHGALVLNPPADAGPMPADYTQNHVFDGVHLGREDMTSPYALDRDFVTEVWFEDMAALAASTTTPYYKDRLRPDEAKFVDLASVAPGVFRATPRHAPDAGPFKLFAFLKAAPSGDLDRFASLARTMATAAQDLPGVQDSVCNIAMLRPGAEPFAHGGLELWFEARASAVACGETHLAPLLATAPKGLLDPAACLYLLAEEFTTRRLRAEA